MLNYQRVNQMSYVFNWIWSCPVIQVSQVSHQSAAIPGCCSHHSDDPMLFTRKSHVVFFGFVNTMKLILEVEMDMHIYIYVYIYICIYIYTIYIISYECTSTHHSGVEPG